MIELRHLETLAAIERSGSLVEAAEHLHVTQSALSHQLKELEGRLGLQLLNRRTRPLRFTPAGEALLALGRQVLPQVRQVERQLRQMASGQRGRLFLAIECHSCFQWLMPALETFRSQWPEVELDLSAAFAFAPLPALLRGDLDLVITSDPQPHAAVRYLPLFRYELVAALKPGSELAGQAWLEPEDFRSQTLLTYPVEAERLDVVTVFLRPAGVEPAAVRTAELTPMLVQLAASGRGVATLPNWALDEYRQRDLVAVRPLGEQGVWRTLYAAVRDEDADNAYVQDFMQLAHEHCFAHLHGIRAARVEGDSAASG